jgi:hypothetical protein
MVIDGFVPAPIVNYRTLCYRVKFYGVADLSGIRDQKFPPLPA